MPTTPRRTTLLAVAAAAGILASAALSGCTPAAKPAGPATAAATGGSTPRTVPSVTPTPTDPPTPVGLTCEQVVTPEQLQASMPSYAADPGYAPKAGSLEKRIADWQGVACAWHDKTSGDVIQVAVARPPASALEGLKNSAITASNPVPTYGVPPQVEGYFAPGSSGQVQIFRGSYWIVADSTVFQEPGDAAPLMEKVLESVPSS